ncbi:MAG: bifunctional diguanylate cyclase/phosphodiesterase [Lachnospiraceae bacterium]
MKAKKDVDVNKLNQCQNELQKKELMIEELNTFVAEYNFEMDEIYIDSVKDKYILISWEEELRKRNFAALVYRPDILVAQDLTAFSEYTPEKNKKTAVLRLFTERHKYDWFRVTAICFFDSNRNRQSISYLFTNINERAEIEQNLKFYSEKDTLTALPNMRAFLQSAQVLIEEHPEEEYEIVRMDIERFRIISEMFGIDEGDKLLKFIAVKIQEYLDEEDEVAYCRIASDVFAMCIPVHSYSVDTMIQKLQKAVTEYPKNYEVVLSFGRYYVTKEDREQKVPVSNLVDRAAAAQITIKGNYLQHVAVYDESIRKKEADEAMILSEMNHALENGEFQVYLQPKVNMQTGKIIGSEALVRWQHPGKGLISPAAFVPVFEKNGFIIEIDKYMIRNTCAIIRRWIDSGIPVYPVSVNLSRLNLYNKRIIQDIREYVEEYQIPREYISFEITESAFSGDNSYIKILAEKLQKEHFKVLMDDFGSGYSSLNTLKEIPVDVLKIDLKFLPAGENDEKANLIIKHVVEMAVDLDLMIIVEGVEREEQVEFLTKIGCKIAQGFYYYRPISVQEYEVKVTQS